MNNSLVHSITKLTSIVVDCDWDDWQVGECDKSCGGGLFTKNRVPKVDEQYGGEACTGRSTVTESCNIQECPGKFIVSSPNNMPFKHR